MTEIKSNAEIKAMRTKLEFRGLSPTAIITLEWVLGCFTDEELIKSC